MTNQPSRASVEKARALLTQWSEQEGCTVVSRYEGDRWDKLVDIIATALDQQIEKDAGIAENGRFLHDDAPDARFGKACATAIRQQGAR